jgi:vacuolar iron transporter family protein
MSMFNIHRERHHIKRLSWLRAAVLGANDGIISTASLVIGVAAAHTAHHGVVIAGIAGLIAGAMSMAAGEYISVSSQKDTEKAELQIEKRELETNTDAEIEELTSIYRGRGLEPSLAKEVAIQLMAYDALEAHARDELGITETLKARPYLAAISSGCSFTAGSLLPLLIAIITPTRHLLPAVSLTSVIFLGLLGVISAMASGSNLLIGITRVIVLGSLALFISATIGSFLAA